MFFIKGIDSLDVGQAFETLFPQVNSQGMIVFNKIDNAEEADFTEVLEVFRKNIHSNSQAGAGAVELPCQEDTLSLKEKRHLFKLIQKIEEKSTSSPLCAKLLNTVQNFVFGKVSACEGKEAVYVNYEELKSIPFLQNSILGEYSKKRKHGEIELDPEIEEQIVEYLAKRDEISLKNDINELISFYFSADYLSDKNKEEKICDLIKKKVCGLQIRDFCAIFREIEDPKILEIFNDVGNNQLAKLDVLEELGSACEKITKLSFPNFLGFSEDFYAIIEKVPNLRHLKLGVNYLTNKNIKKIIHSLNGLRYLNSLDLSENRISRTSLECIVKLQNIKSLTLNHCKIGLKEIELLVKLVNLQELSIRSNKIGDEEAEALSKLINLRALDLSHNRIGLEGIKALARLTNLNTLKINALVLNDPSLTKVVIGGEVMRALAQLTNLHTLDLCYYQITLEGLRLLAQLTNIRKLSLSSNEIGAEGARVLVQLTNLHTLDLYANEIGDDGARALAELTNLHYLNLVQNKIGDDGAKALAKLMNLQFLYLSFNQIGDDGAKALAELINLRELYLHSNQIGDDGAKALVNLMKFHNLYKLDISFNKIIRQFKFEVQDMS